MCGSRRGGAVGSDPPPLKNNKNVGFLSNTGLDPLKITMLPSQHSMLGHHQHTMMAAYSGICLVWILPPLLKKKLCQSWTPLTKLSGSAHEQNIKHTKSILLASFTELTIIMCSDKQKCSE